MTAAEAAKLLDLGVDATPEQLESRFQELRRRLEEKIAKAPTPGLQAKYRSSLAEVTAAFETLTLAADASLLPMLNRAGAVGGTTPASTVASAAAASPAAPQPPPARPVAPRKAPHAREFALVAVIAVLVLAAGGWYVMKVRADKAERLRVETEQRLAAEVVAREAAAKAAAEADRLSRLGTQLRTALAEQRVNWEAIETKAREAERRASEIKSELRGLRDAPATKKAELSALAHRHGLYSEWLSGFLARHPAKLARARAEEFLNAKAIDEAVESVGQMTEETAAAEAALLSGASALIEATGNVELESIPAGIAFEFTDTYGHVHRGTTPARLTGLPLSHVHDPRAQESMEADLKVGELTVAPTARFRRTGWEDVVAAGRITEDTRTYRAEFPETSLQITSTPAGLDFEATNALGWKATGKTPGKVTGVPPGAVTVRTIRPKYRDVSAKVTLEANKLGPVVFDHRAQNVRVKVAEAAAKVYIDGKLLGQGTVEAADLPPGNHTLRLELAGQTAYQTTFTTAQEVTTKSLTYSFAELSIQNITCSSCNGGGQHARQSRCGTCGGTGREACYNCDGRGTRVVKDMNYQTWQWNERTIRCESCNGRGRQPCSNGCDNGVNRWFDSCTTCGGDGRLSKLDRQ